MSNFGNRHHHRIALLAGACGLALLAGALTGCQDSADGPKSADASQQALIASLGPAPTYSQAAAAYNQRVAPLDRLFARANIQLTYLDKDGELRTEQPEGMLQIIRPDKLSLNLGKAGQNLFWFGCDSQRYWWLDLSDKDDKFAAVGRHDLFGTPGNMASKRLGVAIRPRDLIMLLGIVPLDPAARGVTQWASNQPKDGSPPSLMVLAPVGTPGTAAAGWVRLTLDAKSMMPRSIDLMDAKQKLILTARHEGEEQVEITRSDAKGTIGAGALVPMAGRVYAHHFESGTDFRLTLTGASDKVTSQKAFELAELVKTLRVDRQIDLDAGSRPSISAANPAIATNPDVRVRGTPLKKPAGPSMNTRDQ